MRSNEIISYLEMCAREGLSLQRGMNFNATGTHSIVLSSHRPGAPYDDVLEENDTVLIYEGHDEPKTKDIPYPKRVDQPLRIRSGKLTKNGYFHEQHKLMFRVKPPLIGAAFMKKSKMVFGRITACSR